jgi:transcriptional regulator with XRE-family HTH domain
VTVQDELNKIAGTRLRELRIAARMSQEELSFAANVDQQGRTDGTWPSRLGQVL